MTWMFPLAGLCISVVIKSRFLREEDWRVVLIGFGGSDVKVASAEYHSGLNPE